MIRIKKEIIVKNIFIFLLILTFIIILKHNTLRQPYHWDATTGVIAPALDMYDNNFQLIHNISYGVGGLEYLHGNYGHPPLQHIILAMLWKIFGVSILVSHLYTLIIGCVGLIFTYKLGRHLFNPYVGLGSAVLLLFNQLFFAQIGILNFTTPLVTLGVISVYYYVKEKRLLFIIFSTMLVMVKETAAILLFAMFMHFFIERLIKNHKLSINDIKECLFIIYPLLPLFIWFIYLKISLGWAFRTDLIANKANFFYETFKNFFKYFFYDITLDNVTKHNFIISAFIVLNLRYLKNQKIKIKMAYLLIFLVIITHIILFSYTSDLPNYFTVIMPFYLILGAHSIHSFIDRFPFGVYHNYRRPLYLCLIIICSLLFVSNYHGLREGRGWRLESNMEYLDLLYVQKEAVGYIETNFPNETIFTCWPMTGHLTEPRLGFVSKRINSSIDFFSIKNGSILYLSTGCDKMFDPIDRESIQVIKYFSKKGKVATILSISNNKTSDQGILS